MLDVLQLHRALVQHTVDLFLGLAVRLGVFNEQVEGKAQQSRSGLVAGDQEGDEIVDDG